ncbi:YggS family pyridoxal phosphate enzyme [Neorhizobium galegae]|nr:YggS family pyridoxal phosphate enzyme [Neorhizobium galegae]
MSVEERLRDVKARIEKAERQSKRPTGAVTLVAVSKTFDTADIRPVIAAGQRMFGENRVQESQGKWPELKAETPEIELHLIGPLQSNKAADAVALFDVIETVDREKIARTLADEIKKQGRRQSSMCRLIPGWSRRRLVSSRKRPLPSWRLCRKELGLSIEGLMCIPPAEENPGPHFALLAKLAKECGVEKLSMGMSGDFETAVEFGATSVRVGSAIFGSR